MIRIALVPRARPVGAEGEIEERRGFAVVERDGKVQWFVLESTTPGGLRLELQTFLERFAGETIEVAAYRFRAPDSELGVSVVAGLLPGIAIIELRQSAVRRHRFKPDFGRKFAGQRFERFSPDWYVRPEPMPLLKGVDFDAYRCAEPIDLPKKKRVRDRAAERARAKARREVAEQEDAIK